MLTFYYFELIIVEFDMFIYFLSHMIRLFRSIVKYNIRISDSRTLIIMVFLSFSREKYKIID